MVRTTSTSSAGGRVMSSMTAPFEIKLWLRLAVARGDPLRAASRPRAPSFLGAGGRAGWAVPGLMPRRRAVLPWAGHSGESDVVSWFFSRARMLKPVFMSIVRVIQSKV